MTWSRGLLTGLLLAGVLLLTVACNPDGTSSQPNGNTIFTQSTHGCTGSQTITVQNGDTLTVLVENHVSGSFAGIVAVYQRHEFAEEKRAALEKWAEHVQQLVR